MFGELRGEFGSDTYGAGSWQGRIAYTHGPGIDAPLSFVRHGLNAAAVTIVPHANWRGTYGAGTYKNGSTAGILDLTTVHWPADDLGAYLAPTEPYAEDQPWIGALIGNIQDANGWLYRRNRYYDPQTGRFTQEDPIGIAGGLNLYAFGGGDVVSYSDPYGLKVEFRNADARALWNRLVSTAREAMRSSNRDVAVAGRQLNRMLRQLWDAEGTISIGVDRQFGIVNFWNGGARAKQQFRWAGNPARPLIGAIVTMDPTYTQQRYRVPNELTLAHELGHAWGFIEDPENVLEAGVVAENLYRRIIGCNSTRVDHGQVPPPCH